MSVQVFEVDVIPPHAGVVSELALDLEGQRVVAARFRAIEHRRRRWPWRKVDEVRSEWSGWFEYDGEPIVLTWAAFWS